MDWNPRIEGSAKPKYLALVEELQADIAAGRLRDGDRLPPQRDIASRLGITIATVTRAFAEATRRGLVAARTGSGTFVRASPVPATAPVGVLDLSLNTVPAAIAEPLLKETLRELSDSGSECLFGYQPAVGSERHRRAMANWFSDKIPAPDEAEISLTHGAQHALAASFAAFVRPGDTVLTERWTYTGIRRLATTAQARLEGVAVDEHGLCPADLKAALKRTGAKVVICSSVVQNPTTATMSLARREEIVSVCRSSDALLVEDDLYGRLSGDAHPTLAMLAPSHVIYVSSVSKSISPGVRLGIVVTPPHLTAAIRDKLVALHWTAPSFFAELFLRLVANGGAEQCLKGHRMEMARRVAIARELFGNAAVASLPSYHLWLQVPEGWRSDEIVADLLAHDVRVSPSSNFLVDPDVPAPSFVRVSLGAVDDFADVEAGLRVIASIWSSRPRIGSTII